MGDPTAPSLIADSDADFTRFGLDRDTIAAWEDGARTDNRPGTYEWWYFDAHLHDGATLVVVFLNKDLKSVGGRLSPVLQLNLDLPDGRSFQEVVPFRPDQWAAATDHADVRIGANRLRGDLREYRIEATAGEISVDVTLRGEVPPWRPATGHLLFGPRRNRTFGWLPAVPLGRVTGSYTVDGRTHDASGLGYHDHNWGTIALPKIVHNWYWARGQAGPYAAITSYITSTKRYGHQPVTVFMLARDGRVIADDAALVRFATEGVYTDDETGKPVATTTRYTYERGDERIEVAFHRERDLPDSNDRQPDRAEEGRRAVGRLRRRLLAVRRADGGHPVARRPRGRALHRRRHLGSDVFRQGPPDVMIKASRTIEDGSNVGDVAAS